MEEMEVLRETETDKLTKRCAEMPGADKAHRKAGLGREKEPVSLLFIQQTLNSQLMPGILRPRGTALEMSRSLPQGTYSLEEEDQQVSKTDWEGAETMGEAGQGNRMEGVL